jgi:hypothetical protein
MMAGTLAKLIVDYEYAVPLIGPLIKKIPAPQGPGELRQYARGNQRRGREGRSVGLRSERRNRRVPRDEHTTAERLRRLRRPSLLPLPSVVAVVAESFCCFRCCRTLYCRTGSFCVATVSSSPGEVRDAGSDAVTALSWQLLSPLLCGLLVTGVAEAREVQLAGMRLGQHAVNLLDIYGQPMGIATGQGEAFASGGAAPGSAWKAWAWKAWAWKACPWT